MDCEVTERSKTQNEAEVKREFKNFPSFSKYFRLFYQLLYWGDLVQSSFSKKVNFKISTIRNDIIYLKFWQIILYIIHSIPRQFTAKFQLKMLKKSNLIWRETESPLNPLSTAYSTVHVQSPNFFISKITQISVIPNISVLFISNFFG